MTLKDEGLITVTVQVPKGINDKMERDKRQLRISKSYILRSILMQHYASNKPLPLGLKVTHD